jgi:hypothetical protein
VSINRCFCPPAHRIICTGHSSMDGHPDDVRTKTRPRYHST